MTGLLTDDCACPPTIALIEEWAGQGPGDHALAAMGQIQGYQLQQPQSPTSQDHEAVRDQSSCRSVGV